MHLLIWEGIFFPSICLLSSTITKQNWYCKRPCLNIYILSSAFCIVAEGASRGLCWCTIGQTPLLKRVEPCCESFVRIIDLIYFSFCFSRQFRMLKRYANYFARMWYYCSQSNYNWQWEDTWTNHSTIPVWYPVVLFHRHSQEQSKVNLRNQHWTCFENTP